MKINRRIFSLVLCALLLLTLLCGCEDDRESLERILQKQRIVFGVEPDCAPFVQVDSNASAARNGELGRDAVSGISADIAVALAEALNVEPVYVLVEPQDALSALNDGRIDCYVCLTCQDIKTVAQMRTVDTGIDYRCVVVSKAGAGISSLLDIKGRTVAVVSGSDAEMYFESAEVMHSECAGVVRYADLSSLISGLSSVDAGIVEETQLLYQTQGGDGYDILDSAIAESDYLLCVRLRDEALADRLSELYSKLVSNGTIDEIIEKWLGITSE